MIANSPAYDVGKYAKLVSKALPVIVTTEEENERLLAEVDKLMSKGELSPEESRLFDLLVHLIEEFEDEHYRLDASTPLSILHHLMEARGIKPRELWDLFGSKSLTSDVLNGRRAISRKKAVKLGKFFGVAPGLFLEGIEADD